MRWLCVDGVLLRICRGRSCAGQAQGPPQDECSFLPVDVSLLTQCTCEKMQEKEKKRKGDKEGEVSFEFFFLRLAQCSISLAVLHT